jgi:lipopolysaccharide export system protein LptA
MINIIYGLIFLFLSSTHCYGQILDNLNESENEAPIIIDAEQSVVCDEAAQKCTATGLAKAQKGTSTIYGDVLTVFFTDGKERKITALTGDGHVKMETPKETAYGDHVHYDVALDRVLLTGQDLKIITQKEILTAQESIEYWHTKNQGIARGCATARFPDKKQLVQADTLVVYFKPSEEGTKNAKKKTEIDRVEAEGNVLASGPNGIVTGDRGTYNAATDMIEVFNNVKVTQGENVIKGEYGRANLKTNIAEIFPNSPHATQGGPKKRISGLIIPKSVKNMKAKESDKSSSLKNPN